ncbi:MAG: class I SAM-dependent methyltransferase [Magnetococcales bacterium]|nr:class I SAM-dependent methyltransferase [Magnetococcales bacterium]
MSDTTLNERQLRWQEKPVLRKIYKDLYARLTAACNPGATLEIGGGSGDIKGVFNNVVTTDILPVPWVDLLADAQALPFANESFDNIVMFDVLHHIENPGLFFKEAQNVLTPGGRIVMVEPYMSPVSEFFYSNFHHEPVLMHDDPWQQKKNPAKQNKDPFDSNSAIPTLIFHKNPEIFIAKFPTLHIKKVQPLSLFVYPLSGGYQSWSLIPNFATSTLLKLENFLLPFLGRFMAFRSLIVLEKEL